MVPGVPIQWVKTPKIKFVWGIEANDVPDEFMKWSAKNLSVTDFNVVVDTRPPARLLGDD